MYSKTNNPLRQQILKVLFENQDNYISPNPEGDPETENILFNLILEGLICVSPDNKLKINQYGLNEYLKNEAIIAENIEDQKLYEERTEYQYDFYLEEKDEYL